MEKYVNEEYLKNKIIGQSRHLFLYGYENCHRSEFLQGLENDYPVIIGSDKPIALYIDTIGIPKINEGIKDRDSIVMNAASKQYLYFTIASKILQRSMEYDKLLLDNRLNGLILDFNAYKNQKNGEICATTDLLKEIETSRDFYMENYIKYSRGLINSIPIEDISISFLQIESFVNEFKKAMSINSYFGIILDKKSQIELSSTQAINGLISSRINKNISIKVATTPNSWETYIDENGQLIEPIHDYGKVELDDSYDKYRKKILTR